MSSLRPPFLYRQPWLYAKVMRLLYGRRGFRRRYEAVAQKIPPGASVVEVCCGDCRLALDYLLPMGAGYVGLDVSPHFVAAARAKGLDARVFDFERDELPAADVVLMHGSLYHFIRDGRGALEKMLAAARQMVIVAEPVRNMSHSRWAAVRWLSKMLTRTDRAGNRGAERFTAETFAELCRQFSECAEISPPGADRECVAVFRPRRAAAQPSAGSPA